MPSANGRENGGPPARLATIEEILAASETEVVLPALTAIIGEPRAMRIRKISRSEFLLCLPPSPPGSDAWKPEEWEDNERTWLATLSPDELALRRQLVAELPFRISAAGAVVPTLSVDQARRLGEDVPVLAREILRFSGLAAPIVPTPEPTPEVPLVAV